MHLIFSVLRAGGISTPLIAHWPKGIARHGVYEHQVGHLIDAPAPQVLVDELCERLPDFRNTYVEDGLAIQEFADYAPLQSFRSMFVKGWDALLAAVREQREGVQGAA